MPKRKQESIPLPYSVSAWDFDKSGNILVQLALRGRKTREKGELGREEGFFSFFIYHYVKHGLDLLSIQPLLARIVVTGLVRGWRPTALKQTKEKGSRERYTSVSDKKKKITEGNYGICSFRV